MDKITKSEKKKLDLLENYSTKEIEEIIKQSKLATKRDVEETIGEDGYLKVGLCSDKHYNDKECDTDAINEFYNKCNDENVEAVVDAGDITAGIGVYKGQVFDLVNNSYKDQLDYVIKNHPRLKNKGKTYMIGGNHDLSWNDKAGIDFVEELSKKRHDIIHIGNYQGKLTLNDIKIGLQHGARGIPYAISYHLQKYIEKIPEGEAPDIYVLGHYHQSMMMNYRGVMCFLPGAFQRGNLLTKRMGLSEDNIGGWIVEIIKEKGKIIINPKYYKF